MFIAKIYTPQRVKIAEIMNINELQITQKLNAIGDAQFTLATDDEYCTDAVIGEMNFCDIYNQNQTTGKEDLLFEGIIGKQDIELDFTKVYLFSQEYLRTKKEVRTAVTGTVQVNTALGSILSAINAREATGFTLDCDITTSVTLQKTIDVGTKFLDALKIFAESGYEFKSTGNTIVFKETVGEDKSTGTGLVEYQSDKNEPRARNIGKARIARSSDTMTNVVYDKSGASVVDTASVALYGRLENTITTGPTQTIYSYVADRKLPYGEYEITPKETNFTKVNVGDIVKVTIKNHGQKINIDSTLKVVEKKITGNEAKTVQLKLAKGKLSSKDIFEIIKEIRDIQRLQLL